MMSHIMCKFTKIKVSVVTKKIESAPEPISRHDIGFGCRSYLCDLTFGRFCPYFKGQLFSVTLNFTTQTMLLNGSSYNIYIYYEGWLLLSVYVVHALISLLWHFWPHAGRAIWGASAIYMGLTWVQGHGYLHCIADILAQSLFSRKTW